MLKPVNLLVDVRWQLLGHLEDSTNLGMLPRAVGIGRGYNARIITVTIGPEPTLSIIINQPGCSNLGLTS